MKISPLRACFVDSIGSCYLPATLLLSKHFSKMYYYTAIQSPFPHIAPAKAGQGYEEIEVINTFWDRLNDFDIIIFGDIYYSSWVPVLKELGKLTFGGTADILETNRKLFMELLERLGMDFAPTEYIKGIKSLRSYLKSKKNRFVKVSYWRGIAETFQFINNQHSEIQLDEIEYSLGPLGEEVEFIVQISVDADAEVGYDGFTVNGKMPQQGIVGIEVKNAGYLGRADYLNKMPYPVQITNEKFTPALQAYQHTGFYSTEVRYNSQNNKCYYIDPCMRLGSPPSNTYLRMIENWGDIISNGARGLITEPQFAAKYGCEIILKSSYANNNYLPIMFPEEYKDNINLKGSFKIGDQYYIMPFKKLAGFELEEFGSVTVIGNDVNEIMQQALNICESIETYDVKFDAQALEKAIEQMNNVEQKTGYKF